MSARDDVGEVLGWGTFAKVVREWDELLDRPVAVKELVQPFAGNEVFVRAYFAQALRMVDVAHPNLLAIYSVEPNRFPPLLTREMAEQPVAHRLFDGALDCVLVADLLSQALAGLAALHARDLLHLSIRPENLLLTGDTWKLGDFGIAPLEGAPSFPPRQLKYSAPELAGDDPQPSPAADVYSLGLVAWELLLGSARLEQVLEEMLAGPSSGTARTRPEGDRLWLAFNRSEVELPPIHEIEPAVPVALSLLLERMIRKDRDARTASAREALTALGSLTADDAEAASAAPRTAADRAPRSPAWLAGGVGAALAVAGTALWFGLQNRPLTAPAGPPSAVATIGDAEQADSALDHAAAPSGSRVPPPSAEPAPSSIGELAAALRREVGRHPGLRIGLDPRGGSGPRLPFGAPLRFTVESDRHVYVVLFALSQGGSLTCLYPGPERPAPEVFAGRTLVLPRPEDERAGFELITTPPAGTDLVFLLASESPLPALPAGRAVGWVTEYSFEQGSGKSPAVRFVRWVRERLAEDPGGVRLALQPVEVVPAGE